MLSLSGQETELTSFPSGRYGEKCSESVVSKGAVELLAMFGISENQ
jgi:hypothetical protein